MKNNVGVEKLQTLTCEEIKTCFKVWWEDASVHIVIIMIIHNQKMLP